MQVASPGIAGLGQAKPLPVPSSPRRRSQSLQPSDGTPLLSHALASTQKGQVSSQLEEVASPETFGCSDPPGIGKIT